MSFFLLLKSIILCNLPHVPYTQEFEQKNTFLFFPLKFDHLIYKGIRHLTEKNIL